MGLSRSTFWGDATFCGVTRIAAAQQLGLGRSTVCREINRAGVQQSLQLMRS